MATPFADTARIAAPAHRAKVNRAARDALAAIIRSQFVVGTDNDRVMATEIVKAITLGKVPRCKIEY